MGAILLHWRLSASVLILSALAGLTGCASVPGAPQGIDAESAAGPEESRPDPHPGLIIARDMIGSPYRYGGAGPGGFDCSGLVYYSYRKAGISAPRTTIDQYRQSKRVRLSDLQPGDLVFFKISRNKLSHVGIYAGGSRFIHAPSSGKSVGYALLRDPFWRERVVGAGRLQ